MSAVRADVFVGRGEELAGVLACAAEAASGRPWVVLVDGPAGVGKSAFVKHVIAVLSGSRGQRAALPEGDAPGIDVTTFDVIKASAEEIAQDEPMWLLDQLIGETTSRSPLAGAMDLLDVLAQRQAQGPVLLVLEDLHWVDEDSRTAMLTAAGRLDGDRVLTLITTRPEVLADERVARLADDPDRCRRVTLDSLTPTDVAALADRLGVPLGPNAATRLQRHTAGLALHVRTLLRELTPEELNAFGALPAPRSLAQTTVRTVAAMPDASIALLRGLAVLGHPAPLVTLNRVVDLDEPTAALQGALRSGLVQWSTADSAIGFVHPLYAAAVYDDIPPVQRQRLHLVAAAVDPRSVLFHRMAAADRADERLAAELEAAAELEPTRATRLLVAASDLSPAPDRAARRLLAAAHRCYTTADLSTAIGIRERLESSPPSASRDLVLGWIAWRNGDPERAEAHLTTSLAQATTDPERAAAWLELGALYAFSGRGPDAVRVGRAVLALPSVDPIDEDRAWRVVAAGVNQAVGGIAALEVLDAHYRPSEESATDLSPQVQWSYAVCENCAGRPEAALSWFHRLLPAAHRGELAGNLAHIRMLCAQCCYRTGAWDEALVHANTAIDLANDQAQAWVTGHVHAVASWIHAGRGQWELAERRVGQARSAAEQVPIGPAMILTHVAEGFLGRARGDARAVVAALSPLTAPDGLPPNAASNLSFWPAFIHALVDVGHLEQARRQVDQLRDEAAARRLTLRAQVLTIQARIAAANGDEAAATLLFDDALASVDDETDLLERIVLHHSFGRHHRAAGRRRAAAAQLATAHALATSVGAVPYADRIDADLRRSAPTPARATRSDPLATLTERERDVVTLIVGGATNREAANSLYVSVKAIEYHLGNVYAKLHLTSRRQLTTLVSH